MGTDTYICTHAFRLHYMRKWGGGWGGRSQSAAKVGNRVDLKSDSTIVTHMVDSQSEILNTWTKRKQQEKKH